MTSSRKPKVRLSGDLHYCGQATPAVCRHRTTLCTEDKDHAGDEVQLPGTVYLTPCELQLSPPWRLLDIWRLTCLVYRGSASEDYLWRALWIYSSSSSSWHVALPLEQHRATATGSTYSNVGEIWTSGYWDTRSYRQRDTYMPITIRRPSTESEVKTPASFNI